MEFAAWFIHKYVMHGFLWKLHYDHHNKQKGFFEKNDLFFLIFAIPSVLFFIAGINAGFDFKIYIGLGILIYGLVYFLIHEVLIHRRYKKSRKLLFEKHKSMYFKKLEYAHKMHHSHTSKNDGESFGMLIVSSKYSKKVKNA
jgi:beta-carotene 3-hydroxylase